MKQIDRDALRGWEQYKQDIRSSTPVDVSMTHAERDKLRRKLEADPVEWARYFFPSYAKYPFAPFHRRAIKRVCGNDEWYEVLSWSRELAKSTVTMFIVSYLVLTGKKRNVLLCSNSYDNAVRLLAPYRANLEANGRIEAFYGKQPVIGQWTEGEFKTKGGASFRAIGAGQSPRGTRNDAARPDVILVDDIDTDEDCKNPDIINKRWDWFEQALYPTRSVSEPTLVLFCGNIIAKDCCVVRAGAMADHWDIVNIRDKQGRSTWPEKNTEEDIDRVLAKVSSRTGQAEYFNNPICKGEVFETVTYGKIPPLSKFKFLVEYGDPAPGESKSKGSSTKAVMLLGKLKGKLYVIRPYVDHALNSEFIQWYVDCDNYVATHAPGVPVYRYMENNKLQDPFFQHVFRPMVAKVRREQHIDLYIRGDEEKKTDKFSRIEANLEPLNREGNLILNEELRDDPHMKRLEEQFILLTPRLKFPADGPDCVEGGNRIIENLTRREQPAVTIGVGRSHNRFRM